MSETKVVEGHPWIERVKAADAEAETWWRNLAEQAPQDPPAEIVSAMSLIAIAAELRAARIARRPGAGQ